MSDTERSPTDVERRWLDVSRVVFFNDAIFAIAMTVLVLNFRVPDDLTGETEPRLMQLLGDHFDDLVSYALSFGVLAYFWVQHHRLFARVQRADHTVLYLNLTFLACVALLPFPSELLQHYGSTEAAVVMWSLIVTAAGAVLTVLTIFIGRHGLYEPTPPQEHHRHIVLRTMTVPVVFAASIPVAIVNVTAAKVMWILVVVCFVAYRWRFGSIRHTI